MKTRLASLDVMRGLTIALMIQVNNPGSYDWTLSPQLTHALWHGCTMTDLVFPFFLFAMGAAMALSLDRRRRAGEPPAALLRQATVRGLKIIGIGLVLNAFPFGLPLDPAAVHAFSFGKVVDSIAGLRLPGVLQRIGGCWLLASALIILVKSPRRRVAAAAGLLLIYEFAMRAPLVPGWGHGSFEGPDNFARWLDLHILGAAHMASVHVKGGLDPEGLLPTLNGAVTALLGFAAVSWLGRPPLSTRRLAWLAAVGLAVAAVARLLVPVEPINKALWTTTYVFFSGGLAAAFLALVAWVVDVRRWRRPSRAFEAAGMNPMLMYFGSGILAKFLMDSSWSVGGAEPVTLRTLLYLHAFVPWAGPEWGSILFATAQVGLWMAVAWVLYLRGWAWRV